MSKLSELNKEINKVLDNKLDRKEFNLRYLTVLLMMANIKSDPDLEIYFDHQNGKDVFMVVSSELDTYKEIKINGQKKKPFTEVNSLS